MSTLITRTIERNELRAIAQNETMIAMFRDDTRDTPLDWVECVAHDEHETTFIRRNVGCNISTFVMRDDETIEMLIFTM